MKKIIAFDMDGTIADLYGVDNWLDKLLKEDPSPYRDAQPLYDMDKINSITQSLRQAGYEIQVITACSKSASPEYEQAIYQAKKAWLEKWGFIYDHFHGIRYQDNKSDTIKNEMEKGDIAILIDDEERHTSNWEWGSTINPTQINLISALISLLERR